MPQAMQWNAPVGHSEAPCSNPQMMWQINSLHQPRRDLQRDDRHLPWEELVCC